MNQKLKIKVKPEGRKNIWLPDKDSLIDFVNDRCGDTIHNFIPTRNIMLGADHSKIGVLRDIQNADRLAIFTDPTANMGHALALIGNNKLECYDIGKITQEDIEIIDKELDEVISEIQEQ